MIRWTPRFIWDDGTLNDETLELPVGLWRHQPKAVGGDIESDAGFPASYVIRRDACLMVPLRYFENEWPVVRQLIEHGQGGGEILWYPDAEESLSAISVFLEAPAIGDPVEPVPDGEYPAALTLFLVFRRSVDGETWDDMEYFEEAA